jgi:hypothetical protein
MARASNVLPAPGLPAMSMLWTKDRTLFSSYFTELLDTVLKYSSCTIGLAVRSR